MTTLVIDTETTGLPQRSYGRMPDPRNVGKYATARLLELGYAVYCPAGKLLRSRALLVRPEGFEVQGTEFHGITAEVAAEGAPVAEVLEELTEELEAAAVVVAHNMEFDANVLAAEWHRLERNTATRAAARRGLAALNGATKVCTMKDFLQPGERWPRLPALHRALTGKASTQAHRALPDALLCAECYFRLRPLPGTRKIEPVA